MSNFFKSAVTKDNQIEHDLSFQSVLWFFLAGAFLVAVSDVPNDWGALFYLARGFLILLLFAAFVIPRPQALILLLMLALAGQDIVSSGYGEYADPGYATASIWQIGFGPVHSGYIIFGCLLWQLLRMGKITVQPFVFRAIVWFSTVPIIAAIIYGGFLTENARVEAVVDIRFAVMLLASIMLFLSFYKKYPQYFKTLLAILIGVLLARHLMDFIYVIANIGPEIAQDVSRGSEDSAKGAVVILVYLGIILIMTKRYVLIGVTMVISSVVLLVAYGTRNLWITFMLGIPIFIVFIGLRRIFSFLVIGVLLTTAGLGTLFIANPTTAELIYARSKTLIEGRPVDKFGVAVESNIISRIDQVRYAQIFNVFDSINRRYAWLWGTGYGGYYEDDVIPFPSDLPTAFAEYSFQTGKYYRTHQFTTHMFLKYGLLGWLCIISLWFIPGIVLFKMYRKREMFAKNQPIILHCVVLCLAAFLPTGMLQTFWSSKGLFINGMIIASCMTFAWKKQITSFPKLNLTASFRNLKRSLT